MEYENKHNVSQKVKGGLLATVCAFNMVGVPLVTTIHADTVTQEIVTESEVPALQLRIEDTDGNSINGTFGIYADSECITKIQESHSTDGTITFNKTLEKGKTYYIKQTEADSGYELDTETYSFCLKDVSPADDKITFSFDGKNYGMGESDIYRVEGDWGDMKISLRFTNNKSASSEVASNGTSASTTNGNTSDAAKAGTTKSNGSSTATQTNLTSFEILAGLSAMGIVGAVIYKHKKEGGVNV